MEHKDLVAIFLNYDKFYIPVLEKEGKTYAFRSSDDRTVVGTGLSRTLVLFHLR